MLEQAPTRRRVAVVIPTFDEKENIAALAAEVLAEQKHLPTFELHVVVSDSTSRDGTIEIVERLAQENPFVHLNLVRERGIGLGLYNGFCYSIDTLAADVLVEMDADFQHNPSDLPMLLNKLDEGYDLVIGSRFAPGSVNKMPWYRWVLSVGANQLIRSMLGLHGVREITTSYRAFTRELFLKVKPETVPWRETSFIAVPVFLVRMLECGARAAEVPMTMHPRTLGYSKMDYTRYILDIVRFSLGAAGNRSNP
ncbi:MAG: glycosyltransferase [Anaerolineae bacterium]